MNKSRKSGLLIAGCAVILVAAAYFGVSAWRARDAAVAAGESANAVTLDPALYTGPAHDAYRIARERPQLLAQLHCYCGCDRVMGHKNLLDCFRNTHASYCAICIGEAIDAERMQKAGTPVEQIRDTLRQHYSRHES